MTPFPVNPELQAHENPGVRSVQLALELQLFNDESMHSLTP